MDKTLLSSQVTLSQRSLDIFAGNKLKFAFRNTDENRVTAGHVIQLLQSNMWLNEGKDFLICVNLFANRWRS